MLPEDRDPAYLLDMLQAARKVANYLKGKTREDYWDDSLLHDAVERNIEIIGEAARRVSDTFKLAHPEIPWRKIIAQRNVLIHEYDDISNDEIWDVAWVHVPALISQLAPLIPPLPPEEA